MEKDTLIYLEHILDCIQRIKFYSSKKTKVEFLQDFFLQDAVIRNLEIIGEATKHLDSSLREKYSYIPWRQIAGLRDKLIHNYFGIDLESIWEVVESNIPILEVQIQNILKAERGGYD